MVRLLEKSPLDLELFLKEAEHTSAYLEGYRKYEINEFFSRLYNNPVFLTLSEKEELALTSTGFMGNVGQQKGSQSSYPLISKANESITTFVLDERLTDGYHLLPLAGEFIAWQNKMYNKVSLIPADVFAKLERVKEPFIDMIIQSRKFDIFGQPITTFEYELDSPNGAICRVENFNLNSILNNFDRQIDETIRRGSFVLVDKDKQYDFKYTFKDLNAFNKLVLIEDLYETLIDVMNLVAQTLQCDHYLNESLS